MMPFCGFQNIDKGGGGRGDFQMGDRSANREAFAKAITLCFFC
jgi:hypothetical protein